MLLISHRGNTHGPYEEQENNPDYIQKAIDIGYEVEIDVWKIGRSLWLGHDEPIYRIQEDFLSEPKFLCHAKNIQALEYLMNSDRHCFWHQEDHYTITNKGRIISYPGYAAGHNTICMKPELQPMVSLIKFYAVCSDYVALFKSENSKTQGVGFNETR